MDQHATQTSKTFDVEQSKTKESFNVYDITFHGNHQSEACTVTFNYTQKNYDEADPTWISLTLVDYSGCIPDDVDMFYNYHDSKVSNERTITLTCKGPFKYREKTVHLIVDGIWKDGQTVEPYTLTVDTSMQAAIKESSMNDCFFKNIISDSVASRMIVTQPSCQTELQPYKDLRNTYKVVDYGNPALSLYAMIIVIARGKTEIVESIEFDNLQDFEIVGEASGTTSIGHKLLVNNRRILLKRTKMSEDSFSFKSVWKPGKVIKAIPGGAGDWGDHRHRYLTAEQVAIVKPPIQKQTKESGSLQVPKGGATKQAFKSASPGKQMTKGARKPTSSNAMRKPSPAVTKKSNFKK